MKAPLVLGYSSSRNSNFLALLKPFSSISLATHTCSARMTTRDSAYDDINLHDDASISDTDDDEDYEDCNRSHGSCCGGSMALEGPDLPLSVGFHFMNGGNTIMRTA